MGESIVHKFSEFMMKNSPMNPGGEEKDFNSPEAKTRKRLHWGLKEMAKDVDAGKQYTIWKDYRKKFVIAAEENGIKEDRFKAILALHGGESINNALRNIDSWESMKGLKVLEALNDYFKRLINSTMQREKLFAKRQGPAQTYFDFYEEVRDASESCDFTKEEMERNIKERTAAGSRNPSKFKSTLDELHKVSMDRIVRRAFEMDESELQKQASSTTPAILNLNAESKGEIEGSSRRENFYGERPRHDLSDEALKEIAFMYLNSIESERTGRKFGDAPKQTSFGEYKRKAQPSCNKCSYMHRGPCSRKPRTCFLCSEAGHIARFCVKRPKKEDSMQDSKV